MKRLYLLLLLLLGSVTLGYSQAEVQIGSHRFVPDQNIGRATRGKVVLPAAVQGHHNVLVQLRSLPTESQRRALQKGGLELQGYLGGNAYWALLQEGVDPQKRFSSSLLRSVMPIASAWKVSDALVGGAIPAHALAGEQVYVTISFASNGTEARLAQDLAKLSASDVYISESFRTANFAIAQSKIDALASLPYVLTVSPIEYPQELENYQGRLLSGAGVLNTPVALGGKGLLGKGMRVGIWDGNVMSHVDFENRVHSEEYELTNGADHGTHVAGTVLGAGLMDPNGRGMAPKAQAWTYNFNKQRNGMSEQEEMFNAHNQFGISLTQNSYGISIRTLCRYLDYITYFESDQRLDRLAIEKPLMTHVYAAGNNQSDCSAQITELWGKAGYGTTTKRAKNIIAIGALTQQGRLASFSSMGPQPDGRLFPHVCAKGQDVYSTADKNGYQTMDGTSMACPTATGTLALISERYKQLNQGKDIASDLLKAVVMNTAIDAGRPGPDFQYGYGVLNAVRAVDILERQHYAVHTLQPNETQEIVLTGIPAGAKNLKVMLYWHDPSVAKVYGFRDTLLVQDLDLRVNGKMPLVLNGTKGHVEEVAKEGEDHLNNSEQVVIADATEANYTAVVSATKLPMGPQRFVVTWSYDQPEARIIYPAHDILASGEATQLRLQGMTEPYMIEISYDGGKTYTYVGRVRTLDPLNVVQSNLTIRTVEKAPVTTEAYMRVITASGKIIQSPKFGVAPQPKGLTFNTQDACGLAATLRWESHPQATRGYVLLRYDSEKADFVAVKRILASAEKTDPQTEKKYFEYELSAAEAAGGTLWSVAASLSENEEDMALYGKRSIGVVLPYASRLSLQLADLPVIETMQGLNSGVSPLQVSTGSNLQSVLVPYTLPGLPAGSSVQAFVSRKPLAATATQPEKDNPARVFDWSNEGNVANMALLQVCDLDLTQIPEDEQVILYLHVDMAADDETEHAPQLRVVFQPTGADEQVLETLHGKSLVSLGEHHLYYPLQSKTQGKLRIEWAAPEVGGQIYFEGIRFISKKALPAVDVQVGFAKALEPKLRAAKEQVEFYVVNNGTEPVKQAPVFVSVRGEVQKTEMVENLLPGEKRVLPIELDLSSISQVGELIPIEVACNVADDLHTDNNVSAAEFYNMGDVVLMPKVTTRLIFGIFPAPHFPKEDYQLTGGKTIFTDDGGALRDHEVHQQEGFTALRFKPSDPTKRVRVRFKQFEMLPDGGLLGVLTTDIPDLTNINPRMIRDILSGKMQEEWSFVSEAKDGSVTFVFMGDKPGPGWVAEIDEVYPQNALTLVSAVTTFTSPEESIRPEIQVTLRNNFNEPLSDITLTCDVHTIAGNNVGKVLTLEGLKLSAKADTVITLTGQFDLVARKSHNIVLRVLHDRDYDASDNIYRGFIALDRYCIPPVYGVDSPNRTLSLIEGQTTVSTPATDGFITYAQKKFPVYKNVSYSKRVLRVLVADVFLKGKQIYYWVDWKNTGSFDGIDRQEAVNNNELHLQIPEDAQGDVRLRVVIGKDEECQSPCIPNGLESGIVRDFTLEVLPSYPFTGDLGVENLEIASVTEPTAEQPFSFDVVNNGVEQFTGTLSYTVQVNSGTSEEFTHSFENTPLEPFGANKVKVTPDKKIDMTNKGRYRVTVRIKDPEQGKGQTNNNRVSTVAYSTQTATGKNFALDLQGSEVGELVVKDATVLPKEATTLEFWAYFEKATLTEFLHINGKGDNFVAYTAGQSIAFVVGSIGVDTEVNAVPVQQWNHIAICYDEDDIQNIFVNGKPVKLLPLLNTWFSSTAPIRSLKTIGFDGKIDELRIWKKLFTSEELTEQHMNSSYKEGDPLWSSLALQFSFDEGYGNYQALSTNGQGWFNITADAPRVEKEDNTGTWVEHGQFLFGGIQLDHQLSVSYAQDRRSCTVYLSKEANLSALKGKITSAYRQVEVQYKDQPVTEATVFDGSTGSFVVKLELKDFFGKQYDAQEITIHVKQELYELTEVKLLASDNAGITEDYTLQPAGHQVVLSPKGVPTNLGAVKVHFTVSAGAKAMFQGQEITSPKEFNFNEDVYIQVMSPDQKSWNLYTLRMELDQTISWTLATTQYVYGTEPVAMEISTNSGLPITFESTAPAVATANADKLHLGKPGTTQLRALQLGNRLYKAADPVEKSIEVTKAPLQVTPMVEDIYFGEPVEVELTYDNLIDPMDIHVVPNLLEQIGYTVEETSTKKVYTLGEILPKGTYMLKAANKAPEHPYYTLAVADSEEFQVKSGQEVQVTFMVKTQDGAPVEGAQISIAGQVYLTKADGSAVVAVDVNRTYSYKVLGGTGYLPLDKSLEVGIFDLTEEVTLTMETVTLQYNALAGGTIEGLQTQTIQKGSHGSQVVAKPAAEHTFTQWQDNQSTEAKRADQAVMENLTADAAFAVKTYAITYKVSTGGQFKDGTVDAKTQAVAKDAQTTAEVEAQAGYEFAGWDDGNNEANRTDVCAGEEKVYVALFKDIATQYTITYKALPAESGATFKVENSPVTDQKGNTKEQAKAVEVSFDQDRYEFVKWSTGETSTTLPAMAFTGNEVITAFLKVKDSQVATISYKVLPAVAGKIMLDGSVVTEQIVAINGTALEVEAQAAAGYQFARWQEDGSVVATRVDANVAGDMTRTAIFEERLSALTVSVTSSTGEAVADATISGFGVEHLTNAQGQATIALAPGSYTFQVKAAGYVASAQQKVMVEGASSEASVVLTPIVRETFTLTLVEPKVEQGEMEVINAAGSTIRSGYAFKPGEELTVRITPAEERFMGLELNGEDNGSMDLEQRLTTEAKDLQIRPLFKAIEYVQVTFISQGKEYTEVDVEKGHSLGSSMPAAPERPGYDFVGWSTSAISTTANFTAQTVVDASVKVYAVWKRQPEKKDPPKVTPVESTLLAQVSATPNPATSALYLTGVQAVHQYTLYNALGVSLEVVRHNGDNTLTLNVSQLANGIYWLQLEAADGVKLVKFVKQ